LSYYCVTFSDILVCVANKFEIWNLKVNT